MIRTVNLILIVNIKIFSLKQEFINFHYKINVFC